MKEKNEKKVGMFVIVGILLFTIALLAIGLISVRTELVKAKAELSYVSVEAEMWEKSFRIFYGYAMGWPQAESYARESVGRAYMQVYAPKLEQDLGLDSITSRRIAFEMGANLFDFKE